MQNYRKNWLEKEDQLRGMLAGKTRFSEGISLFLAQHASVHSAEAGEYTPWSLHDEILQGLNDKLICTVPRPGLNSIAWILWHITRIEDMTINLLTMEQEQVWNNTWASQMGYSSPNCGASMDIEEVSGLSLQICVPTLLAYRLAVARRTRESVTHLSYEKSKEIITEPLVRQLQENGSISPKATWLYEYYLKRTRGFFLIRTATSHNFHHLNEAMRIKNKLSTNKYREPDYFLA